MFITNLHKQYPSFLFAKLLQSYSLTKFLVLKYFSDAPINILIINVLQNIFLYIFQLLDNQQVTGVLQQYMVII